MAVPLDPSSQFDLLVRTTADVIPTDEFRRRLGDARGRPGGLRVKLGIDPSRPDLHLGHAVVLRKLRQFQDLGHTAVLIVGDFTGRVGDPSGQSETRPFLTEEEIDANAQTYLDQAGLVLDLERAEIHRNSEWLATLSMVDVLHLTASMTVARMLERDDFQARFREGRPISVVEFLYPLMQAMDSVAIRADVEMGGTDQTFNLLVGRDVQRLHGQEPQIVYTMPLLEGTDGVRKMSKSFDNFVALTDPPDDMFGKLMRVPDDLIVRYMELCTDLSPEEIAEVRAALADRAVNPMEAKRRMASAVVGVYHGASAAEAAAERFDLVHRQREIPQEVPKLVLSDEWFADGPAEVASLLLRMELVKTKSEARRLARQGGVRKDGVVVDDPDRRYARRDLVGSVWQVGRRRFARLAES